MSHHKKLKKGSNPNSNLKYTSNVKKVKKKAQNLGNNFIKS